MYLGEFMKDAENANLSQSLVDANVLLGKVHNERVSTVCIMISNNFIYFLVKSGFAYEVTQEDLIQVLHLAGVTQGEVTA